MVFLKRYFVLQKPFGPGFPAVVPFKPTHDTILKLFANKDNDPRTYPLQAIGQAYDTLGTNPVSYAMVRQFYDYWMRVLDFTPYDFQAVLARMHKSQSNRLFKKIGMDVRTTMPTFPSLELLMSMHKIDREKGTNKIPLSVVQDFYNGNYVDINTLCA